jgi:hypothetical protein
MVARSRGLRFSKSRGYFYPGPEGGYTDVLRNVAAWLGFTSINSYLTALRRERRAIFKRAAP